MKWFYKKAGMLNSGEENGDATIHEEATAYLYSNDSALKRLLLK